MRLAEPWEGGCQTREGDGHIEAKGLLETVGLVGLWRRSQPGGGGGVVLSERGGLTRKAWAWPRDGGHAHVMRCHRWGEELSRSLGMAALQRGKARGRQSARQQARVKKAGAVQAGSGREAGRLAGSEAHLWVGCVTPMQQQQAVAGDVCLLMVPSERGGLTGKVWA